jgi:hypothetical protein
MQAVILLLVGTMANEAHLYIPHCPSTCASVASAWDSQKVISMVWYSIHAAGVLWQHQL